MYKIFYDVVAKPQTSIMWLNQPSNRRYEKQFTSYSSCFRFQTNAALAMRLFRHQQHLNNKAT
jgi:hypothetical protein